ncbi:glycosyltransferase family protein 64 C3 [Typha latifolia]|uniref:glycosyltransferase family protein 64 C3 n=1 Tax=Typha latifolia TaxID=4733 RepID=UPI003C2BCD8F
MLFLLLPLFLSISTSSSDYCDPSSLPDPLLLRSDQLTVLLSGYSPLRLPLLRRLALSYSSHPSVAAVLLLWFNPSHPPPYHLFSSLSSSVSVIPHSPNSSSLNLRFLPRPQILTRFVAVADDDVSVPHPSLSFAFSVFRSLPNPKPLVGFFPRSHDLDIPSRDWIYTVHRDRYSILLTKFVILTADLLREYSCDPALAAPRRWVDRQRNCEDILMNFVAARATGVGPVMVAAEGVRDYGDPRNSVKDGAANLKAREEEIRRVGLSSRGGDGHWRKRGECIREFHRMLGMMPLRYSYGKVVEGVREQGLCSNGEGKLVLCDQL